MEQHKQLYVSNPNHAWHVDHDPCSCASPPPITDWTIFNATRRIAALIEDETTEGFIDAINLVKSEQVRLTEIDCYVPVIKSNWFSHRCSADVVEHRRFVSLVELWMDAYGARFNVSHMEYMVLQATQPSTQPSVATITAINRLKVLDEFLRVILLPTGLAARYEQGVAPFLFSIITMGLFKQYRPMVIQFNWHCHVTPVILLIHAFPTELGLPSHMFPRDLSFHEMQTSVDIAFVKWISIKHELTVFHRRAGPVLYEHLGVPDLTRLVVDYVIFPVL